MTLLTVFKEGEGKHKNICRVQAPIKNFYNRIFKESRRTS